MRDLSQAAKRLDAEGAPADGAAQLPLARTDVRFTASAQGMGRTVDASAAFGLPLPDDELSGREALGTRLSSRDGVAWLALGGELDVFTAATLRTALAKDEVGSADSLVLDMRGVTFLDSSGLAVILGAYERALSEGREPVRIVIRGSAPVESLFRTIGAGEYLHLIDGPSELTSASERT